MLGRNGSEQEKIPDLAKTSNVKNYTRMASKPDKLRNLDFQAESP